MSLCPEAELRAAMTDGDFWAHVFQIDDHPEYDPDDDPNVPDVAEYELNARLADPCTECGQVGACAYDPEGRPMIHVVPTVVGDFHIDIATTDDSNLPALGDRVTVYATDPHTPGQETPDA